LDLKSEKARFLKGQWTLESRKRLCTVFENATRPQTGIVSEKFMDQWILEGYGYQMSRDVKTYRAEKAMK
jgi:hypothetical protein